MLYQVLRPGPAFSLAIEADRGTQERSLPFSVPLYFARKCEGEDVVIWRDVETNTVGLFSREGRVSWPQASIRVANIAVLHPSPGKPGVVGLEIASIDDEEERPVLAADAYSREALDWFKAQRETWRNEYFGVAVRVRDYGLA